MDFIGGVVFGVTLVLLYNYCFHLIRDVKNYVNKLIQYDNKNSSRVLGFFEDRIVDGKWTVAIVSLWRANYFQFFVVEIDELNEKKVFYVDRLQAREFILKHARTKQLAIRLLRDWELNVEVNS